MELKNQIYIFLSGNHINQEVKNNVKNSKAQEKNGYDSSPANSNKHFLKSQCFKNLLLAVFNA